MGTPGHISQFAAEQGRSEVDTWRDRVEVLLLEIAQNTAPAAAMPTATEAALRAERVELQDENQQLREGFEARLTSTEKALVQLTGILERLSKRIEELDRRTGCFAFNGPEDAGGIPMAKSAEQRDVYGIGIGSRVRLAKGTVSFGNCDLLKLAPENLWKVVATREKPSEHGYDVAVCRFAYAGAAHFWVQRSSIAEVLSNV